MYTLLISIKASDQLTFVSLITSDLRPPLLISMYIYKEYLFRRTKFFMPFVILSAHMLGNRLYIVFREEKVTHCID